MNLHEYQAKRLFADYGIGVPRGIPCTSPQHAGDATSALGGDRWVVKAQVHAGGRGKAGGVKLVSSADEAYQVTTRLLGTHLTTHQTGAAGLPIHLVLVEEVRPIARELYLSCVVDRASERVLFMASSAGGMDIEEVAAYDQQKILTCRVDPAAGLQPYQCRDFAFALELAGDQVQAQIGRAHV